MTKNGQKFDFWEKIYIFYKNLRWKKNLSKFLKNFWKILANFWKISTNFWKISANFWKEKLWKKSDWTKRSSNKTIYFGDAKNSQLFLEIFLIKRPGTKSKLAVLRPHVATNWRPKVSNFWTFFWEKIYILKFIFLR